MWLRLDDTFDSAMTGLSDGALRLHLHGLLHCARQLTDGHIPATCLRALAWHLTPDQLTTALSELAGLWEQTPTGYYITTYLQSNPSRQQADELRQRRRIAGHYGGVAKALAHATPDARANATADAKPSPSPSPFPFLSRYPSLSQDAGAINNPSNHDRLHYVFTRYAGRPPSAAELDTLHARITNPSLFADVLHAWRAMRYNPATLSGILDWYDAGCVPPQIQSKLPKRTRERWEKNLIDTPKVCPICYGLPCTCPDDHAEMETTPNGHEPEPQPA